MKDQVRVLSSFSNEIVENKLETLSIGESKVRLCIPKRHLAPCEYTIDLNLNSRFVTPFTFDRAKCCLKFELNDFSTSRANSRQGFFSTLIDWEIVK